jgi:arabinogalactan endo-1,4-beta-galactosidase
MIQRTVLLTAAIVSIILASAIAQTLPTTRPQRGGFRRATNPSMIQDTATGQWYTPQHHAEYAFGVDVSSLKPSEDAGRVFKDTDGTVKPALAIFKYHGFNWIRLRTCVPPVAQRQPDVNATIAAATDAKKLGFNLLLDIHYSNSWADPTNEPTPSTWRDLSHADRVQAVFEYTRDTIAAMAKADVLPDIIQVGNEVSNGFMWPSGKLPENWNQFADYIYAGVNGIDAGRGNGKRPRIMIHVDHGGNIALTRAFFDKFNSYNIPYDMIGFSFYPWSHGTLMDLKENLDFTARTYDKDLMVVETGYYHQPSQYFRETPGPFPETPEGQAAWIDAVNKIVMETPGDHGKGIFYWEPTSNNGRSFFDNTGTALDPVFSVFHQFTRPAHRVDDQ